MDKILIFGAGRSAGALIDYLIEHSESESWEIIVADITPLSDQMLAQSDAIQFEHCDVKDDEKRSALIQKSSIVISMLPASLHLEVAQDCIQFKKNMVTASYISSEMKSLDQAAKDAGVLIMNEIGVDPGIDHISAKRIIDRIEDEGGVLTDFETFTGGLVAPEFDNNPWNYKFTWNPRNVVLAGQGGTVKFIQEGTYKYIPYHKVFRRTELIEIDGYGSFEGIANRDSLKYRSIYGLEQIKTMYRGTLRRPGFCRAWDAFVQLGATDDSYQIADSASLTFRSFINLFLPYNPTDSVELKLKAYLNISHDDIELFNKLKWLDIFEEIPVELENASPAQILQKILLRKWKLADGDKDMIVMWHKFIYESQDQTRELHSSMVIKGDDKHTAMAKTVGLPVAITTKLILNGKINQKGVQLPISPEVYHPILNELKELGIDFIEKEVN